jgi:uncharacterized protein YjbJ (UPF0337 family)
MHWDQVQGSWNHVKGKAKQMWGDLTDDELDTIAGKRDDWSGGCIKHGINKEKAHQRDSWIRKL